MDSKFEKILEKIKQEGDYKKFTHKGLVCEIKRNGDIGNLCGYVVIPKHSIFYGVPDHELPVSPHGGVTFSKLTKDGEGYIIGFDCGHSGDFIPSFIKHNFGFNGDVYRDMEYVEDQVRKMAEDIFNADSEIGMKIRDGKINDIVDLPKSDG